MFNSDVIEILVQKTGEFSHKFKISFVAMEHRFELRKQSSVLEEFKLVQKATESLIMSSHGIGFEFLSNYTLRLYPVANSNLTKIKCNIINLRGWTVMISELSLESLKVKDAKECICSDRVMIDKLDVVAGMLKNTGTLEVKKIKLQVDYLENEGNLYILSSSDFKLAQLNNDGGNLHGGGSLRLDVAVFSNVHGKISAVTGTFIKVRNSFNSNEYSELGFSAGISMAASVTELNFIQTNTIVIAQLGSVKGTKVKLNQPIVILQQGLIVGKQIHLTSANCIKMLGVNFTTNELRICAPDFLLSPQTSCDQIIVVEDMRNHDTILNNPSMIGKAIVTQFKTQAKTLALKLEQGDYFGTDNTATEIAVEVTATVGRDCNNKCVNIP